MKIKYGILSTASITTRFIQGIKLSEDGVAYAVASRDTDKARNFAKQNEIERYYDSYEALCQDPNVDVVYIATPNYLHYDHIMLALHYNKHVVCEKPFVLNKKQAHTLFKLAKTRQRFVMEAQKSIFVPAIQFVYEQIKKQTIGDLNFISLTSYFEEGSDKRHWMYDNQKGGGVLYGSASYTIELMQYLLDASFTTITHTSIQNNDVDEIASFLLQHDDCIINSTISRKVELPQQAILYGSKGTITIPFYWRANTITITLNGLSKVYEFPFINEFVYEVNHINTCITSHLLESPIMTHAKTLECVRLVETMKSISHMENNQ